LIVLFILLNLRCCVNRIATEFLTRCFLPGETIAVLLRNEKTAKTQQRIVTVETVLASRYLSWLTYENRKGANIYVSANTLLAGSRKRTKESIAAIRHLYLDLDMDGAVSLAAIRSSDLVPQPAVIIRTSADKYQVMWKVEGFDFETQEMTLKVLATTFGGDPACTDCNRVLRIPGFLNRKYEPAWPIGVQYISEATCGPEEFHLASAAPLGILVPTSAHRRRPEILTNSDHDWAWVSRAIAQGREAVSLTHELASRRSDKPNPLYYAQRTVDMASARSWLIEGRSIAEVVEKLEHRRRSEIPGMIRSTRAREIATTAQRMIARQTIA
jgi:hypothetical protein